MHTPDWAFKMVTFSRRFMKSSSWLAYVLFSCLIIGWWVIAFRPISSSCSFAQQSSQSLTLNTSTLLRELSVLQREDLHDALSGNFSLMLKFIDQWDLDALRLINRGIEGIQRLPLESQFNAHILKNFIQNSSSLALRQLNCKMNIDWIVDDSGRQLHIEDRFQHFLPQTYIAASFLLAIAPPQEIIALPKGLRQLKQLYSQAILAQVPLDIDQISSEKLYLKEPHLAFIAPYSHPPTIEVLRNQNLKLYSIKHICTIEEIQEALLKVGHASNHIIEAQLLVIFMKAALLSIDNRLLALREQEEKIPSAKRLLYLTYRHHYAFPTTKCLTGQLMARALKQCPYFLNSIPENQEEWQIPVEQEQILEANPDFMIISTPYLNAQSENVAIFQKSEALQSHRMIYIDEIIQESPTQYVILAYFDIFQALRECLQI